MAKNTSGAVHLTSLDLDITQLQSDIQTIKQELDDLSDSALKSGEVVRSAFSGGVKSGGGSSASPLREDSEKNINVTISAIESLNLAYKNFLVTLTGSKVDNKVIKDLLEDTKEAARDMASLTNEAQLSEKITKEQKEEYAELSSELKRLKGEFADTKTGINEQNRQFENLKKGIEQTIPKLKTFEKSATFSNSRKEASALRAEFEKLYSEIKNGTIDIQTAQSVFSSLDSRFTSFSESVKTGTTAIQNFVNKISESAKWQVANSLLSMFQQAMGNVLSTITDTEDAVIELRRVLSDAPLAAGISDELYQIAYDFGQTFENVQEVAVKFAQTGLDWEEVVDATRATMLGLNTAELEVATATEGLIAVMAQFGVEASDLESVIDKINTTADHFPVTSEKIVAALQRAGGTASAFGLSLEETIGVITALSEATGRAGEAIGTAMNSLISFSMKDTALEKFSEFLGKDVSDYGVLKLWNELSEAINGGNTELAKMMAQSEEFSDMMDETLATSVGLEEEYTLALKEQNEALKDGKDIYSTVGTYRQNYFIALLNNIGTATEAIEGMDDALGYSLQENATAMETFTKQWNQLVVSAQELAVQFGEAGFLDLVKDITAAATAVLKFTKDIGGLNTVLLVLSTAIIAVKREKLNTVWNDWAAGIQLFIEGLGSGEISIKNFIKSFKNINIGFGSITTAAMAAITAFQAYRSHVEQTRQANIDAGKTAAEEARNIITAYKEYEKATKAYDGTAEAAEEYERVSSSLRGELEKQGVEVGNLATAYDEATDSVNRLADAEIQRKLAEVSAAVEDAKDKFESFAFNRDFARFDDFGDIEFFQIKDIQEGISTYEEYGRILDDIIDKKGAQAAGEDKEYRYFLKLRKELEEQLKDYLDLTGVQEELIELLNETSEAAENTSGSIDGAGESVLNTALSMEDLEKHIENLGDTFDSLNKQVDGFQSAYKTVIDVIDEYNETGIMTADMLQSLLELEPEYIDLIDDSSGALSINEEKLSDLIQTNDTRLQQLAAIKIAEEAATWAKQISAVATGEMTEAEIVAAITTQALASDVEKAAFAFLQGKGSADDLKSAIRNFATQCGLTGTAVDALVTKVDGLALSTANYLALADRIPGDGDFEEIDPEDRNKANQQAIKRYYTPSKSSSKSSSSKSTKDPFEEKLKAEKEAMDDLIDTYEHQIFLMEKNGAAAKDIAVVYKEMQKTVHEQAEKYRSMGLKEESEQVRSMQKLWWEYQEEIEKVLQGIYEATIEAHENALSLLENQYNKAMESMDYSAMSDNLQKQLSYQKKIQEEAHKEADRLRKLGVDENDEAIQACIDAWWKADDAIQEINSRIEESILSTYDDFIDLADEFDLWDYMDFTKVDYLRAKLDDINKLLKEGTISLKEYNTLLRQWNVDMFNAQKELIQKQQDDVKEQSEKVIKSYEAEIKALEKRKDDVEAYYDGVIKGYEAEIDAWEKRKDEIEDYYDSLIDNLNEVQKANDRINAQIDYYNARQKIITNLEQAQARSGVAWREKEMEYQQQLNELDEEWNRTQEDWKIEDQIDQLQNLKEQATADIDATIEKVQESIKAAEEASKAAVDAIDQEIAGIQDTITAVEEQAELEIQALEDQITNLSQQFAEAIKAGMTDGLIDSKEEFDKAVEDGRDFLLSTLDENSGVMKQNAEETAEDVMFCYTHSFMSPFKSGIDEVAEHMKGSIQSGAKTSAEGALKAFETSFVSPLKSSIASLMNEVQKINISYNAKAASVSGQQPGITTSTSRNAVAARGTGNLRTSQKTPTTVYISNYNSSLETAASKTSNILQQILH